MSTTTPATPRLATRSTNTSWRSRIVVFAVLTTAISVYLGGIVWFGQGLAEDMRAGVREVRPGVLIVEQER
jgi:hypothetical protein